MYNIWARVFASALVSHAGALQKTACAVGMQRPAAVRAENRPIILAAA